MGGKIYLISKQDMLHFYTIYIWRDNYKVFLHSIDALDMVEINEIIYINDSDNLIKKISKDEYLFIRKDSIDTVKHIKNHKVAADDLSEMTHRIGDPTYRYEYANQRLHFVENMISDNQNYLSNLLSDRNVIMLNHKAKKGFLSEDIPLYKNFEKIADYLLFPKFTSKDEEDYFNSYKPIYDQLKRKRRKTKDDIEIYEVLERMVSDYDFGILTEYKKRLNRMREIALIDDDDREDNKTIDENYLVNTQLPKWHRHYFKKMGFKDWKERNYIVLSYLRAIKVLDNYLGYNLSQKKRKEHKEKLLRKLKPIKINTGKYSYQVTPEGIIYRLNRIRNELMSEYNIALGILMNIVSFQQPTPSSTVYDLRDIYFHQEPTYKHILELYSELKVEFGNEIHKDIWCVLFLFDEIFKKTDFTEEEYWLARWTMQGLSFDKIKYEFMLKFNKEISQSTYLSRTNSSIPKKMLKTYLDDVDEWLYTYKLKGQYKQCSSCGEVKLISNDRYFSPKADTKDGFHPYCKDCR